MFFFKDGDKSLSVSGSDVPGLTKTDLAVLQLLREALANAQAMKNREEADKLRREMESVQVGFTYSIRIIGL